MSPKRVLIVEDNLMLAEAIAVLLEMNGFEIAAQISKGEEVVPWLRQNTPDVIIMDVRLQGKQNGIQTVEEINRTAPAPVVFLTAQEDRDTLDKILQLRPAAFLNKPYKDIDLVSAVRLATASAPGPKFAPEDTADDTRGVLPGKGCIFIRAKKQYERIDFDDIMYLHSDRTYTDVVMARSTVVASVPMGTLLESLPETQFVRIHRSFALNINHVTAFDRETATVGGKTLPISASNRGAFMALLQG